MLMLEAKCSLWACNRGMLAAGPLASLPKNEFSAPGLAQCHGALILLAFWAICRTCVNLLYHVPNAERAARTDCQEERWREIAAAEHFGISAQGRFHHCTF